VVGRDAHLHDKSAESRLNHSSRITHECNQLICLPLVTATRRSMTHITHPLTHSQVTANIKSPPRRPTNPDVLMSQGRYVPLSELAAITEKLYEQFEAQVRMGRSMEAAKACQDCVLAGFTTSIDMPSMRGVCIRWLCMPQPPSAPCEYPMCQHPLR
jgi:hypothetical protein